MSESPLLLRIKRSTLPAHPQVTQEEAPEASQQEAQSATHKLKATLSHHNTDGVVLVAQFCDDRKVIWHKPKNKYFAPVPALAKIAGYYDYPLVPGKMLLAKYEGHMYPALLVAVEFSVKAATEKVRLLTQQEQATFSVKRKQDTASSHLAKRKKQRLLAADSQQPPADDRTRCPRDEASGSRTVGAESPVYSQDSEDRIVQSDLHDIFGEEFGRNAYELHGSRSCEAPVIAERLSLQRDRETPVPARRGKASEPLKQRPKPKAGKKSSTLLSLFASSTGIGANNAATGVSGPPSVLALRPVDQIVSVQIPARSQKAPTASSVSTAVLPTARSQPSCSTSSAAPQYNPAREPHPYYLFPFEIEGNGEKRLLVERTAGIRIYIDAAFSDYMKKKKQSGSALARKVIQRLLIGPGNDMRGMRILHRRRAQLLASGVRQPGMCTLLGDEFMTTFKMCMENMGHDTKGDAVSKPINSWKDYKFDQMDQEGPGYI